MEGGARGGTRGLCWLRGKRDKRAGRSKEWTGESNAIMCRARVKGAHSPRQTLDSAAAAAAAALSHVPLSAPVRSAPGNDWVGNHALLPSTPGRPGRQALAGRPLLLAKPPDFTTEKVCSSTTCLDVPFTQQSTFFPVVSVRTFLWTVRKIDTECP